MDDPSDILSLLSGTEQTPQQKALAMAQALRGAGGGASDFARLGQLSGDKVLSNFGSGLIADDQQQQHMIGQAQDRGLQRALMAEKAKQEETYRNALTLNNAKRTEIEADKAAKTKYGPQFAGADGMLYHVNMDTGQPESLGIKAPPKPAPGAAGAAGANVKAEQALLKDFDYSLNRSGQPGKDEDLKASADKIKRLVASGPNGAMNYKLTVRQVPELIQAVNSMISNGGSGTQGQFEHMMPSTWGSDLAKKFEYLTGHPQDANLEAFVKQAYETAEREARGANERQFENRKRRAPFHQEYFDTAPENVTAKVRAFLPGLDDQEINDLFHGKYAPKQAGPGGAPTGLSPQEAARLDQLMKKKAAGTLK